MTGQNAFSKGTRLRLSPDRGKHLNHLRLLLSGVLLIGFVCGVGLYLCFGAVFESTLFSRFVRFESQAQSTSFFECFSGFGMQALLLWAVTALLGTSPVGAWLIHALSFFKCAGIGTLAAFFARSFGKSGVGYYFLTVFPGKILFFIGLLFLYETGVKASFRVRRALKGEGALGPDAVRTYLLRLLFSGGVLLLGALTDTVTVRLFSGVFHLFSESG